MHGSRMRAPRSSFVVRRPTPGALSWSRWHPQLKARSLDGHESPPIIAFIGPQGAGETQLVQVLLKELGQDFEDTERMLLLKYGSGDAFLALAVCAARLEQEPFELLHLIR